MFDFNAAINKVRGNLGLPSWGGGGGTSEVPNLANIIQQMQMPQGGWGGSAPSAPSTPSLTPDANWWENLDPNIKSGIEQPYKKAGESLWEGIMGSGMAGNPRGQTSGAGADVLGEYMSGATSDMISSAWKNMVYPGLVAEYQGALQQYGTDVSKYLGQGQLQLGGQQALFGGLMQDYMSRLGAQQDQQAKEEENQWGFWGKPQPGSRGWMQYAFSNPKEAALIRAGRL